MTRVFERPGSRFGAVIQRCRQVTGLTQEELAERTQLSVRTIGNLERGAVQKPRRDTVRRLAGALGLSGENADHFHAIARGIALRSTDSRPVMTPGPGSGTRGRANASAALAVRLAAAVRDTGLNDAEQHPPTVVAVAAPRRRDGGALSRAATYDSRPCR
jgi:DNA-binding XRE family transcriptional regulator